MSLFSGVFQKSVISAFLSSEAVSIAGQSLFLGPQSFPLPRANELTQHALKGQKLLAQGNALGIMSVCNAPCKGNSFKIHIIKKDNSLRYVKLFPIVLKLLPLQGALFCDPQKPRALPWAKSFCPFRVCCLYELLAFRACCLYWLLAFMACCLYWLLPLQGVLLILASCLHGELLI